LNLNQNQTTKKKYKKNPNSTKKDALSKLKILKVRNIKVRTPLTNLPTKLETQGQILKKSMPDIRASAWMVIDAKTSQIYWGRNYNIKRQIASLTKIMTCLVACELIESLQINVLTFLCEVSETAGQMVGTTANLKCGDKLTLNDCLYAMILPSGNDAA
jgi:serine-type D-Ala-D-Ala carboxypeptidase (penicillin-binding protein 5/6)